MKNINFTRTFINIHKCQDIVSLCYVITQILFLYCFRVFQNMHNLQITGGITDETKAKMLLPRCGCPDIYRPMTNELGQPRAKRDIQSFQPQPFQARKY